MKSSVGPAWNKSYVGTEWRLTMKLWNLTMKITFLDHENKFLDHEI